MFGRSSRDIKNERTRKAVATPDWVCQVVDNVRSQTCVYWIPTSGKGDQAYGCYNTRERSVTIYVPKGADDTQALLVLLHELAHALIHDEHGTPFPDYYRGKQSAHGPTFAEKVCDLYDRYDVLEDAFVRATYALERKAISARLEHSMQKCPI